MGSSSSKKASLPSSTTHTSQPLVTQQVRKCGRPCKIRHEVVTNLDKPKIPLQNPTVEELNANLPTVFPPQPRHNQTRRASPIMEPQGPDEYFDEQGTASAVIHSANEAKNNRHFNKAMVLLTNKNNNNNKIKIRL